MNLIDISKIMTGVVTVVAPTKKLLADMNSIIADGKKVAQYVIDLKNVLSNKYKKRRDDNQKVKKDNKKDDELKVINGDIHDQTISLKSIETKTDETLEVLKVQEKHLRDMLFNQVDSSDDNKIKPESKPTQEAPKQEEAPKNTSGVFSMLGKLIPSSIVGSVMGRYISTVFKPIKTIIPLVTKPLKLLGVAFGASSLKFGKLGSVITKFSSFIGDFIKGSSLGGGLGKLGSKIGGSGIAKTMLKGLKVIPVLQLAMAGKGAFDGWNNVNEIFNLDKKQKASLSQKLMAGASGAIESLTLGLVDAKATASVLDSGLSFFKELFGFGDDEKNKKKGFVTKVFDDLSNLIPSGVKSFFGFGGSSKKTQNYLPKVKPRNLSNKRSTIQDDGSGIFDDAWYKNVEGMSDIANPHKLSYMRNGKRHTEKYDTYYGGLYANPDNKKLIDRVEAGELSPMEAYREIQSTQVKSFDRVTHNRYKDSNDITRKLIQAVSVNTGGGRKGAGRESFIKAFDSLNKHGNNVTKADVEEAIQFVNNDPIMHKNHKTNIAKELRQYEATLGNSNVASTLKQNKARDVLPQQAQPNTTIINNNNTTQQQSTSINDIDAYKLEDGAIETRAIQMIG